MQTFLPLATTNFSEIAKVLDNKRLNKQALEGWQIFMVLTELDPDGNDRTPKGWVNHPAVRMWRGHELILASYVQSMTNEWIRRGFKTTIQKKLFDSLTSAMLKQKVKSYDLYSNLHDLMPKWMLDEKLFEEIASSHRSALLVKDYNWYSQFNWPEQTGTAITEYEYVWPV